MHNKDLIKAELVLISVKEEADLTCLPLPVAVLITIVSVFSSAAQFEENSRY